MYILITFSFFQIRELGLQKQYNNDRGTYQYHRQIMALAFLPEDEIEPMFEHLKAQAATKAICRVRVPNVDPQPNLAPVFMERLHDGHQK